MIIQEIFNSKVEYTVTRQKSDKFSARATIGSRDVVVYFTVWDESSDTWTFEFAELKPQFKGAKSVEPTTALTGSGSELMVFTFVRDVLTEFVSIYHPTCIRFTADKSEGRDKLYSKLLKKLKLAKYETKESDSGDDVVFELVRKD